MRRFYIPPDQLHHDEILLSSADAHHLRTVLRLEPGDEIVLFDGAGAERKARIVSLTHGEVRLALGQALISVTESPLNLALAQGYLKDKKMDELVRRLTELGVQRFVPFMAQRSVPTPDQTRSRARTQRWHKISQEALKQCRRSRQMIIEEPAAFQTILCLAAAYELKLIFWEGQGGISLNELATGPKPSSVLVLTGPEGGFTDDEVRAARQHGFAAIHMGPRILRAETATVAACVLAQYLFGDMGNCS
jgi:16S rRNA (uracil1498-N3)-methyltransferase